MPDGQDELAKLNEMAAEEVGRRDELSRSRKAEIVETGLKDLPDIPVADWAEIDKSAEQAEIANSFGFLSHKVKSPQACYAVDCWTRNYASHLTRACSTGEPLSFDDVRSVSGYHDFVSDRRVHPSDLSEEASLADFFAMAYDPRAEVRTGDDTLATIRRGFLDTATSDVREVAQLRAAALNDIFGSTLVAETLFERYSAYLKALIETDNELKAKARSLGNLPTAPEFTGATMGVEPGSQPGVPRTADQIRETLDLMRRIRSDKNLLEIIHLAGKYWSRCINIQRHKASHEPSDNIDVATGNSLSDMFPSQRAMLAHPASRTAFLAKYADRALLVKVPVQAVVRVRGPIIVAVDESGSMGAMSSRTGSSRFTEAKALAVALANLARLQKRWFGLVSWSHAGHVESWTVPPTQADYHRELVEFCSHDFCGGTCLPLSELINLTDVACQGGIEPDLVIVTDGDVGESHADFQRFVDWRRNRRVRVIGISIASHSTLLEDVSTNYFQAPDLAFHESAIDTTLGIK